MLTFQITKLDGTVVNTVQSHLGGEVVIPISDSRTAKVTLAVTSISAKYVLPLERMLRVYYKPNHVYIGKIVFWGVILTPNWKSTSGISSVEVNAHDPSIWWKKNFVRYGDRPVDDGVPYDGRAIRWLSECAEPGPGAIANGSQRPGIDWLSGSSTTDTSQVWAYGPGNTIVPWLGTTPPARPVNINTPLTNEGVYTILTRGTNIFDAIQDISSSVIGPEWRLRPIDTKAGFYARLDTAIQFGSDKTATVVFHRGFGKNNVNDYEWSPDGDKVVNYNVVVWPGGEAGRKDVSHKALAAYATSWAKYGIYEAWEASRNKDPLPVLQKQADTRVRYYHNPPDFFTIEPSMEAENRYLYLRDFVEGDLITAAVKDGYMKTTATGRIQLVTLSVSESGEGKTVLACVPDTPATVTSVDTGE